MKFFQALSVNSEVLVHLTNIKSPGSNKITNHNDAFFSSQSSVLILPIILSEALQAKANLVVLE